MFTNIYMWMDTKEAENYTKDVLFSPLNNKRTFSDTSDSNSGTGFTPPNKMANHEVNKKESDNLKSMLGKFMSDYKTDFANLKSEVNKSLAEVKEALVSDIASVRNTVDQFSDKLNTDR